MVTEIITMWLPSNRIKQLNKTDEKVVHFKYCYCFYYFL